MLNTKIGKEKDYEDWYNKNTDPYSHRCFTYAEGWAEKWKEKLKIIQMFR